MFARIMTIIVTLRDYEISLVYISYGTCYSYVHRYIVLSSLGISHLSIIRLLDV